MIVEICLDRAIPDPCRQGLGNVVIRWLTGLCGQFGTSRYQPVDLVQLIRRTDFRQLLDLVQPIDFGRLIERGQSVHLGRQLGQGLGVCQHPVGALRGYPEYSRQVFRPDAMPVHKFQNLGVRVLAGRPGVGHDLLSRQSEKPGPQPVRIPQQRLRRVHGGFHRAGGLSVIAN